MRLVRARHLGLAAAVALAAACGDPPPAYRALQAGDAAPEYAASLMDGDTVTLEGLRGRPVLLNIWATWCPPCRDEMPGLQALHERYGDAGLQVVGVSIDTRGSESAIREFAREYGLTFMLLHDQADAVSRRFRTNAVPHTFLIDAAGNIAHHWIGRFEPLDEDVIERVEALLAGAAALPSVTAPDS